MSTFHWVPDYVMEESKGYTTDIHSFESGKEQRRLKHLDSRKSFTLVFKNIVKTQVDDMLAFFQLQHGADETFTWVDPTDDTSYTMRFAEDNFSDERVADDVYNIQLKLVQII